MKYRTFCKIGWDVSVLGLDISLLISSSGVCPIESTIIEILRYAVDHDVNYIDSGDDVDNREQHLRFIGKALQNGYREKVKIAVTLPAVLIKSGEDFDKELNRQLNWLGMDSVDLCLIGRLNRDSWPEIEAAGFASFSDKVLSTGKVGNIGFSFHDHYQVLKKILDSYDKWSFCKVQFSFMDVDHDPGISGVKYAAERGTAVVVTEPLKQGRLIKNIPVSVSTIWGDAVQKRSLLEWGLRFAWNYSEVSTVVADFVDLESIRQGIALADAVQSGTMTVMEEVMYSRVREAYQKLRPVPCPSCRACMPCPLGIDVPRIFEIYNDSVIYGDTAAAETVYKKERLVPASACTGCGICAKKCAGQLDILKWLQIIAK